MSYLDTLRSQIPEDKVDPEFGYQYGSGRGSLGAPTRSAADILADYNAQKPLTPEEASMMLQYADYYKQGQFNPGSKDANLEVMGQADKQWTHDNADSFLQKYGKFAPLLVFAPELLGVGEAGTLAAGDAMAGIGATEAAAGTSVIDTAINAATKFLSGYLDPATLASRVGQQLVTQAVSNVLSGRELTAGMNLESIAKGTALGALSGAAGAGISGGLQSGFGISAPTANNLGRMGVDIARGGKGITSGLAALGTSIGLDANTAGKLAPVVSGFVQGKKPDIKSALLSGALEQVKIPDWTVGANTGLEWVDNVVNRGVKGGVNRAAGTAFRKAIS